jgi:hypothetical protein
LHGTLDAIHTPAGNPCHAVNLSKGILAKRPSFGWVETKKSGEVDFDEPLVHRAENYGCFAAPAMRVAVMIIFLMQQRMAGA